LPLVEQALYSGVGRDDAWLESRFDQGADWPTIARGYDRNGWTLGSMRLNADDRTAAPEVLPSSLEGMDHALDGDSSK